MVVFLSFAVVAATLSAIGVYSVLAYLVSQRTREIGLRLAIGASPSGVVWLFVREGMVLTAVGLTAGLAGAVAADQWIRTLLFGVTPADPTTFAARRVCVDRGRRACDIRARATSGECRPNRRLEDRLAVRLTLI